MGMAIRIPIMQVIPPIRALWSCPYGPLPRHTCTHRATARARCIRAGQGIPPGSCPRLVQWYLHRVRRRPRAWVWDIQWAADRNPSVTEPRPQGVDSACPRVHVPVRPELNAVNITRSIRHELVFNDAGSAAGYIHDSGSRCDEPHTGRIRTP